jgi:uncharacterized protein YdhG (YjbR/CyaY superfamily)
MAKTDFKSVNEYIASQPKSSQAILKRVRGAIRKAVPEATEGISYQIPAYKLNDRVLVYFAGWKEHYSLYPVGDRLVEAFGTDLARYKRSKGTIRFPLSEPVPVDLIGSIAKFRVKQLLERDKPKSTSSKKGKSRSVETQLERVRRICSAMPSVSEKLSHGAPSFFVQKDKGVFATLMDNHHGDGHMAVWLAAPPGLQAALISDAPATYFKPPYVGSSGWIGIELLQIGDEALTIHIREAWQLVAKKKKKP